MATQNPNKKSKAPIGRVERRIYFYRAISSLDKPNKPAFNPKAVLEPLANWIDSSVDHRCMKAKDGREYCCWIERTKNKNLRVPYTLIFGSIRRKDLPQMFRGGKLRSLRIGVDSGLVEKIHLVFFPNNIIGADYNFYGPRLTKFADYLAEKMEHKAPKDIHFDFLLQQDVMNKLKRMKEVRLFNLRVRASYIDQIMQADESLGGAFDMSRNFGQAEDVEIVLRTAPHKKGKLSRKVLALTRKLMKYKELRHNALNFNVRGLDRDTDKMVDLDLLSDKLISTQLIRPISMRSKALDSKSAFLAIKEAYKKLEPQLLRAAGVDSNT